MPFERFWLVALRLSLLCLLLPGLWLRSALAENDQTGWRFAVTPYLWLPTIDGKLKFDVPSGEAGSPKVDVGPSAWLEALDYGLLITGEARKDRLFLFGDLIALGFSADESTLRSVETVVGGRRLNLPVGASLDTGTDVDLNGLALTAGAGYTVARSDRARLDAFGGLRYFRVDTKLKWRASTTIATPLGQRALSASGSVEQDEDLLDGIVGLRGEAQLGEGRWSLPYYVDVGAGSSDLTWQAAGGVAYGFESWDLLVLYRHLYYDQDKDKLLQNFSFTGPAIAARFRF